MGLARCNGGTRCALALPVAIGLAAPIAAQSALPHAFGAGLGGQFLPSMLSGLLAALYLWLRVRPIDTLRSRRAEAFVAQCPLAMDTEGLDACDPGNCRSCVMARGMVGEMQRGLACGEFVPYYQPIVALPAGTLVGFESLARWEHPVRGLVGAGAFIRHAEDAGLIHDLSLALLDRACQDMRGWPAHLTLSINLSPLQLRQAWIGPAILKTLWAHGIAPGRLIVELTESHGISDLELARQVLGSLKEAGVQVALDDFGAGYSSLMRLRELSFDRIKIDRAFTGELARAENSEIVRAMLSLGDGLGVSVVAEGVETSGAAEVLSRLGCGYAQGFLYSPPISGRAASDLIAQSERDEREVTAAFEGGTGSPQFVYFPGRMSA